MAAKTSSNLDANAVINQAGENTNICNEINDVDYANAISNQVKENDNIYNEINDYANYSIPATNGSSKLEARAIPNQTSKNDHHETDDVVNFEDINTAKGQPTLGSRADTKAAKVNDNLSLALSENLYLTVVTGRDPGEAIRLPESAASNCSCVGKIRKPIITSYCVGLISTLAIIAAASTWLLEPHSTTPDISSSIMTTALFIAGAGDCCDVYRAGRNESGVYTITLQGQTVPVYCDMEHGGGWTVFHNRMDGSVEFYNTWEEYKVRFGDLEGEFWWGNDHLATLTATKRYTLRVDLSDWNGNTVYALYTNFSVAASESDNYRLTAEGYTGTAGERDSLGYSNGWPFSTRDRDNDGRSGHDCAVDWQHGGGWFYSCAFANPNGRYGGRGASGRDMIYWWGWRRDRALKTFSMKARPADF